MADGFWNRQQPLQSPAGMMKRPRPDYANGFVPVDPAPATDAAAAAGSVSSHEFHNHVMMQQQLDGRVLLQQQMAALDAQTIGSAYDQYAQMPPEAVARFAPPAEFTSAAAAAAAAAASSSGQLPHLPPDATNTLFVEGLPPDITQREVARILDTPYLHYALSFLYTLCADIFRPFVGYVEARLVTKEARNRGGGGDPLVLCFVDFLNPSCATTALTALQGYKMDESQTDGAYLRLQFSRYPGPRTNFRIRW